MADLVDPRVDHPEFDGIESDDESASAGLVPETPEAPEDPSRSRQVDPRERPGKFDGIGSDVVLTEGQRPR